MYDILFKLNVSFMEIITMLDLYLLMTIIRSIMRSIRPTILREGK